DAEADRLAHFLRRQGRAFAARRMLAVDQHQPIGRAHLVRMDAGRGRDICDLARVLWITPVDDGGAGGAVDVADIGGRAVHHDLPTAVAIEIPDLTHSLALPHARSPLIHGRGGRCTATMGGEQSAVGWAKARHAAPSPHDAVRTRRAHASFDGGAVRVGTRAFIACCRRCAGYWALCPPYGTPRPASRMILPRLCRRGSPKRSSRATGRRRRQFGCSLTVPGRLG